MSASKARAWSKAELRTLLRVYPEEGARGALAALPGRSLGAINQRASKLSLRSPLVGRPLDATWNLLPLTPSEADEITRLTLEGVSTREIAKRLGCSQSTVWSRSKEARTAFVAANPNCKCGKPIHHAGKCYMTPEKVEEVRSLVMAGTPITSIQRQAGVSWKAVNTYAGDLIAAKKSAGDACICGRSFAHLGDCQAPAEMRAAFAEEVRSRLESGELRMDIARALGVDFRTVDAVASPMLAEMAAKGARCACGEPIDHKGSCTAKVRRRPPVPDRSYRWKHSKRAKVPLPMRKRLRAMIRTGLGGARIAREAGVGRASVRAVERDLVAGGEVLPVTCPCGQPRNHSGMCSKAPQPRKPYPKNRRSRMPPSAIEEIRRRAAEGQSARRISAEAGIPLLSVNRHVRKWKEEQGDALPPCRCGRPARHPGGCIVNSVNVLTTRERVFIAERIRAGVTISDVSRETGIEYHTVLKHAAPTLAELHAAGIYCACGRPRGHPAACAATWTSGGRVRGPHPIPAATQLRIVNLLLSGEPMAAIHQKADTSANRVTRVFRSMTVEERRKRAIAVRRRIGDSAAGSESADLFSIISAAMPSDVDPELRDDAIADLYLAVLQGEVARAAVPKMAKAYFYRAVVKWQSKFGPRSLNETVYEDSGTELIDMLSDTTATAEIDEITIGGSEA